MQPEVRPPRAKRLLVLIGSFYPAQTGGPNNSVYWACKGLSHLHDLDVLVATTDMGIKDPAVPRNRITRRFGVPTVYLSRGISHQLHFSYLWYILRNLRRFDVVHCTGIFHLPYFVAAIVGVFLRKKIVFSPRGEFDDKALVYGKWKKVAALAILRVLVALGDIGFHVTSEFEKEYTIKRIGQKCRITVIPNTLNQLPAERAANGRWQHIQIDNQTRKILFLGRLHPKKAVENLIVAVSRLQKEAILLVAGDGGESYTDQLKALVAKLGLEGRVYFVGHHDGAEKDSLLSFANVLVMPSHTENFGNVVLEALSFGLPVIASKGSPWSILETCECGYWVENSPDALAKTLDSFFLLSPHAVKKMKENSRKCVSDNFLFQGNEDRYRQMYGVATS